MAANIVGPQLLLLDHLKHLVYGNKPKTIAELKEEIRQVIQDHPQEQELYRKGMGNVIKGWKQ